MNHARVWHRWTFDDDREWSRWTPLHAAPESIEADRAGAYVLGLPPRIALNRMLGTDPHAVIDAGESGNLRRRICDLHRCITTGTKGHMAGWRIAALGLLERLDVDSRELRLSWRYADTDEHSYLLEGTVLNAYLAAFGELPEASPQIAPTISNMSRCS